MSCRSLFDSKAVYVSLSSKAIPSKRAKRSDDELEQEYEQYHEAAPAMTLFDFLMPNAQDLRNIREVKRQKSEGKRTSMMYKHLKFATVAAQFKSFNQSAVPLKRIRHYNGVIALSLMPIKDIRTILERLRTRPWIYYAAIRPDLCDIIIIIPLMNKNAMMHGHYHSALMQELRSPDFVVANYCAKLDFMIPQCDPEDAWFNEQCEYFTLPEKRGMKQMEE